MQRQLPHNLQPGQRLSEYFSRCAFAYLDAWFTNDLWEKRAHKGKQA